MSTKKKATGSKKGPAKTKVKRTNRAAKKASAKDAKAAGAKGRDHGLEPGQVIEKTYKGQKITVQVAAEGFHHAGKPYRSLTAVAREVTGYPAVSGPFFFGIAKRGAKGGAK